MDLNILKCTYFANCMHSIILDILKIIANLDFSSLLIVPMPLQSEIHKILFKNCLCNTYMFTFM